ncbi:MAG: T9SS C-terminal target domain-containing protein [Sphingobacteriales bacterium]|nr:MAG: T9SS C-terminal target domain-containing protein [Sphingobacteriales bacterium]
MKSVPLQKILSKAFVVKPSGKLFVTSFIIAVITFISPFTQAQSIFTNPITGTNPSNTNPYTAGQVVDANLDVLGTNIGFGVGLTSQATNDRYNLKAWPTGALSANDYIEFKLTPNNTFKINFTSLVYTGSVSTNGPANLVLRSSIDNYASDIATINPTGATISLSAAAFQNITTVINFRIYGYNAGSTTGTYSINNFTFNGTVVPATPVTPVITSSLTTSNTINIPASVYQITASNFPASYNATGLPPGLSINTTTGRITGTPTSAAGSPYNVTISATNGAGTGSTTLVYTILLQTCATTGQVGYNFDAPSASPSSNTTTNVSISDISRGLNKGTTTLLTTASASTGYSGATGSSNVGAAAENGGFSLLTSTYFEFTLTPDAGYTSTLTAIQLGYRSTATGPSNYSIRCSLNSYASDIASESVANNSTWTLRTPSLSPTTSGIGTAIKYRIYGYGGSGASANFANWRIDDVNLTIDVTRTPPTVYAITNNGTSYCAGGVGIAVGLSGSQTGVNYQLILNGNTNVGAVIAGTGAAISFGNQTAAGTYTVNGTYNSTTCVSAMSNPFSITILNTNTWTGTVNTDWSTAGNWACGVVPNVNTAQIDIPSAPTNQPVLNSNILISGILNLQAPGSTLTLNGNTLTLNGTIIGSGSLIGSATSNLIVDNETGAAFNLNFNQNSASNRTLNNYTQNRNATITLSSPLWINGVVNNTTNTGILASGTGSGNLTLLASAGAVSSISYLNAGANISGNINVQSYFTGGAQLTKRGTRMIAFPVRDQVSPNSIFEQIKSQMFFTGPGNTSNNFDLGGADRPNAVTMVTQDETKPQTAYGFNPIGNLLTPTIPATAYFFFYRGDRTTNVFNKLNQPFADPENLTVTYNGPINKGNIDIAVTHTPNVGDNYNGICAIGNPYPSIIDFDAFLADNSTRLEDIISIIKPDRTGQITKVGNVSTNDNFNVTGGGPAQSIRYVQPCQSFYVRVKPGQTGIVTFNETQKTSSITSPARLLSEPNKPVPKTATQTKLSALAQPQKVLKLAISNQNIYNETALIFKEGYNANYEGNDAILLTSPLLNCATLSSDGVAMAINQMPDINNVSSIKILVNSDNSQQNLNLNFKGLSNFTNQNMVLKDKYLNISQPLDNATNNYVFGIDKTVAASFGSERFELQISPKATLALHITKFDVTAKNNTALLKWEVSSNKEIQKFEIQKSEDGLRFSKTGETFINTDTQNNSYTFVDNYPYPTTYYKIKQINTTGSDYSEIKVLNNNVKNPNDYQIYPTSVSDKLNINCKNNIPISLSIQIISLNGNIIQNYKAQQASTLQVPMQQIKPGMYIVKISNAQSKENLYISKITKR